VHLILVFLGSLAQDLSSLPPADRRTAVYDIAGRTVHMPNRRRLEAHSGLGNLMDDPSYISGAKGRGPTPPNVYDLTLREEPFHASVPFASTRSMKAKCLDAMECSQYVHARSEQAAQWMRVLRCVPDSALER
jgi:hypothetical protein